MLKEITLLSASSEWQRLMPTQLIVSDFEFQFQTS